MMRFLTLFLILTLTALGAAAAGGVPSGAEVGDSLFFQRLMESGSLGLAYAGATTLAIKWLGIKLLAAKDAEIANWRSAAEQNRDALLTATRANADISGALAALNATLSRMEQSCELRIRGLTPRTPPLHGDGV